MHILECIFWNACFGMHISELLLRIQMEAASINQGLAKIDVSGRINAFIVYVSCSYTVCQ